MITKVICHICKQPLPIMHQRLNKKSIVLELGYCGYCETMVRGLVIAFRKIIEKRKENEKIPLRNADM